MSVIDDCRPHSTFREALGLRHLGRLELLAEGLEDRQGRFPEINPESFRWCAA